MVTKMEKAIIKKSKTLCKKVPYCNIMASFTTSPFSTTSFANTKEPLLILNPHNDEISGIMISFARLLTIA